MPGGGNVYFGGEGQGQTTRANTNSKAQWSLVLLLKLKSAYLLRNGSTWQGSTSTAL